MIADFHEAQDRLFHSRYLPDAVRRRVAYFPRAFEIACYVRDNVGTEIRLGDAAKRAGMTRSSFSRYFSQRIGMPFNLFVRTVRVERAIEHMERRDADFASLARLTGFRHPCTFYRAFKCVVGKTPRQYRDYVLLNLAEAS